MRTRVGRLSCALGLGLLSAMSPDLSAQDAPERRTRWWQSADVQRTLQLTAAQVQKLNAIFEQGRPERLALRRQIDEMDRLLARVVERGNANEASVEQLSGQVEALRAQANVRRTLMLLGMYRCLRPDQRVALTELQRSTTHTSPLP
jgi:Spy/CpxP family protein refolding chaperone